MHVQCLIVLRVTAFFRLVCILLGCHRSLKYRPGPSACFKPATCPETCQCIISAISPTHNPEHIIKVCVVSCCVMFPEPRARRGKELDKVGMPQGRPAFARSSRPHHVHVSAQDPCPSVPSTFLGVELQHRGLVFILSHGHTDMFPGR